MPNCRNPLHQPLRTHTNTQTSIKPCDSKIQHRVPVTRCKLNCILNKFSNVRGEGIFDCERQRPKTLANQIIVHYFKEPKITKYLGNIYTTPSPPNTHSHHCILKLFEIIKNQQPPQPKTHTFTQNREAQL